MIQPCKTCAFFTCDRSWWKERCGTKTCIGTCKNPSAFPFLGVSLWEDFPGCVYYSAKTDWCQKLSREICQLVTNEGLNARMEDSIAQKIRERAQKEGVK